MKYSFNLSYQQDDPSIFMPGGRCVLLIAKGDGNHARAKLNIWSLRTRRIAVRSHGARARLG